MPPAARGAIDDLNGVLGEIVDQPTEASRVAWEDAHTRADNDLATNFN